MIRALPIEAITDHNKEKCGTLVNGRLSTVGFASYVDRIINNRKNINQQPITLWRLN